VAAAAASVAEPGGFDGTLHAPRQHAARDRPLVLLLLAGCTTRSATPASRPPATEQRFPDPKAAVNALLAACRTDNEPALLAIFGDEARTVVSTGDPARDRERCRRFVGAAKQMTRLDPKGPDTLELVVGYDEFPFPIPLVRDAG
jgi:hypothetical protein